MLLFVNIVSYCEWKLLHPRSTNQTEQKIESASFWYDVTRYSPLMSSCLYLCNPYQTIDIISSFRQSNITSMTIENNIAAKMTHSCYKKNFSYSDSDLFDHHEHIHTLINIFLLNKWSGNANPLSGQLATCPEVHWALPGWNMAP